ncbi:hypothetical protein Ccl03g_52640 [Enterocloster clostridioformis]|jgi:hypothetical protein|nr:hypothetical protein Ccl03g_52640 [Enterocloster clostridioformis]
MGQAFLVAAAVPVKGFLMVVDQDSLIVLYRCSCHTPMPFDFTGIVQGRAIRRRADKYIGTLPIYAGIGTVCMHDRIKVYLRNSRLPLRFTFFCELFTKPADHSFGNIQLPTGQVFKEIPTLIDGNTAIVIQQKEKGFDRRTIVDFIRPTGWEFCVARLSGLRVAVYLRFVFGDI